MRPSKLRRLLACTAAGAVLAGTGTGWVARADTVSMRGVLGFQPDYQSLGLCPCRPLNHPVMPWSVPSIKAEIAQWAETATVSPEPKIALTYSLSTVGVLDYLEEPDAKRVEVWAFGSPETPRKGDRREVTESRETVRFVVALYDPVADKMARWNIYAAINSRMSTHLKGYDNLDLSNPSATYTAPDGSTTLYFAPEVLPMLKWREPFTSPERMAELDAKYRPRIEAAYNRPVKVPAPEVEEPHADQRDRLRADDGDDAVPAVPEDPQGGGDVDVDTFPVGEAESGSDQRETSLDESLTEESWSDGGESPNETDDGLSQTLSDADDNPSTTSKPPTGTPVSSPDENSETDGSEAADDSEGGDE